MEICHSGSKRRQWYLPKADKQRLYKDNVDAEVFQLLWLGHYSFGGIEHFISVIWCLNVQTREVQTVVLLLISLTVNKQTYLLFMSVSVPLLFLINSKQG